MPSAGEVEQFAYCAHNWLLARQGHDPHAQSRRGMEHHEQKARGLEQAELARRHRREGLQWSFRVLAAAASATFLTLEVVFLRASPYHIVFLTTALVLVSASAGMLTIGLEAERRMRRAQREGRLVPGALLAQDLDGSGEVLADPATGLTGRPDAVVATASGVVPVEVKSGHTPERPYESHVLQLACYLHLLEATSGARPPYGLLQYPHGVFRVPWDDEQKERLARVLDRIAEAERTGQADRDHLQPGRCRGCARRDRCDQRLA